MAKRATVLGKCHAAWERVATDYHASIRRASWFAFRTGWLAARRAMLRQQKAGKKEVKRG